MYKYLLVILEKGAVPFCHYSNPAYHSQAEADYMPADLLGRIIRYAQEQDLFINFLYGKQDLPAAQAELVNTVNHVKIVPWPLHASYPDSILVLDACERDAFDSIEKNTARNIILRVESFDLSRLAADVAALDGRFKRLNIHLAGVERFTEADIELYEAQVEILASTLQQAYQVGQEIEINSLTDRLLLAQMNNCDAGVRHLTIAPNGKAYICPGFYHDDPESSALGLWAETQEVFGENAQLLTLGCAPICSQCDAFHCKRCVYLNKLTTLEINVPSKQQCVIAHAEREASRQMLRRLRSRKPFDKLPEIRCLSYRDPFDIVAQPIGYRDTVPAEVSVALDSEEYLSQILALQKRILQKL